MNEHVNLPNTEEWNKVLVEYEGRFGKEMSPSDDKAFPYLQLGGEGVRVLNTRQLRYIDGPLNRRILEFSGGWKVSETESVVWYPTPDNETDLKILTDYYAFLSNALSE